jgi:hypothetical protein
MDEIQNLRLLRIRYILNLKNTFTMLIEPMVIRGRL